jgi:hypothetical protein
MVLVMAGALSETVRHSWSSQHNSLAVHWIEATAPTLTIGTTAHAREADKREGRKVGQL